MFSLPEGELPCSTVDKDSHRDTHIPVVKPDSVSTKIRPVFDTSASGSGSISLNECLYVGPNLLTDLVEILVRCLV